MGKINNYSSWIRYMCLLLSLYIILNQTILFVQSMSIDDEDFCQLQLHRRQYFTDPRPKTVQQNHKHLKIYQVKSVRSVGRFRIYHYQYHPYD